MILHLLGLMLLLGAIETTRGSEVKVPSGQELVLMVHLQEEYEKEASRKIKELTLTAWDFEIDLSSTDKEEALVTSALNYANFCKREWKQWFQNATWHNYTTTSVKRQLQLLSVFGAANLDNVTFAQYQRQLNAMTGIFGSARICPFEFQDCDIETHGLRFSEVREQMAKSRNVQEHEYIWNAWNEASGSHLRNYYANYVNISNQIARDNGFPDMGVMWQVDYETPDFVNELDRLWQEVRPLYLRLQAYTLTKLRERYGTSIPAGNLLPAHITENRWNNIYEIIEPYKGTNKYEFTSILQSQLLDVHQVFHVANKFYDSLGLANMSSAFGEHSMVEQPAVRDVICNPSVWDFNDRKDFRIMMCVDRSINDYTTVNNLLGQVQYIYQYKDLPITFRKPANLGFLEAVGGAISLSATTPQHFNNLGYLRDYEDSYESTINYLLHSALTEVPLLAYYMAVDEWRREVYSGVTTEQNWNRRWWQLRRKFQLINAPNERSEDHFDPGSEHCVARHKDCISSFISHILQFQLHRSLCIATGQYEPLNPQTKKLYYCNIYKSRVAGQKMRKLMQSGRSQHWTEILREFSGEDRISSAALLEFYAPLHEWLGLQLGVDDNADHELDKTLLDKSTLVLGGYVFAGAALCILALFLIKEWRNRKTYTVQSRQSNE